MGWLLWVAVIGWLDSLSVLSQARAGSTDEEFSRLPFVQNLGSNRVSIVWRSKGPSEGRLRYGLTSKLDRSPQVITAVQTQHDVTLEGLEPDTTYFYQVHLASAEGQTSVSTPVEAFRTLRPSGPVRFAFVADTGQASAAEYFTARVMAALMPDLVLHGGDIIYGGFTDENADSRVFAQYLDFSGQMKSTPFFFAIGNHDLNCCEGNLLDEWNPTNFVLNAPHFQSTFHLPTNSATGTEHFYSFDHGDVHFVALYNPWYLMYEFTTNRLQYQWLTNDLATTLKPWKVLFFHHPLASSGAHALDDYNTNGIPDQYDILRTIGPVASQYGVQLILTGHEHDYERFSPIGGFHPVVSGGGGAGLHVLTRRHPLSAQYMSVHECLNIEIKGKTATIQALGTNGVVLDNWVIQQETPRDQLYYASWNTPTVESTAADDGDGNILGQTFDFVGDPILGRHGMASNLGWFYVNNDATHLYLGLASVMIPEAANLFLFVGASGQPGVSSMAGVGNGRIDPTGQGADGLDCLKNLSFVGFKPSVGLLLGDEFADANLPAFKRPGLDLSIGQGGYFLEPTLAPVPGVRIQQYNRSPQVDPASVRLIGASLEQNADFIEAAIPLAAFGQLQPGDVVQIAGMVGLAGFNPTNLTRTLDSALLGASLDVLPDNLAQLAPIRVRLAYPAELDTDGDGLPDNWEIAHGLRPDLSTGEDGGQGDPDQDGATNASEYLSGTDPHDPESVLRLRLSFAGAGRVRLEWPIIPGHDYLVEEAGRLEDPTQFQAIRRVRSNNRTHLLNTSVLVTPSAIDPVNQSDRLYRIRLEK